jgi:SNF2 family DNA or RNA helicase
MYHDRQRGLALYQTGEQGRILGTILSSRAVNDHFVAVPTDLHSLQLATWLRLPVPPVIDDQNYDWPHAPGITPLPHQKVMANFCVLNPHCFNLSDMGTMKTLATLWAADWLMRRYPGLKALIVAPLSTLRVVWEAAIFHHFLGKRRCVVLDGSAQRRSEMLGQKADFYIVNYEGTCIGAKGSQPAKFSGELFARRDIQLVVIDEASAYKHPSTRRHRIARRLFADRAFLWLLTGTPTAQSHLDAYGIARLVNNAYGESYTSFLNRTTVPIGRFKRIPTREAAAQARKLLRPAIRYDIRDVWDGPELTTQQREIDLTVEQKKHLRDLRAKLVVELESGTLISPANEAACRTKYLQIVLGAIYDSEHTYHIIDAGPRVRGLIELLEQAPSKVLILSPFTSICELLYSALHQWDRVLVTGATSSMARAEIFNAFQSTDKPTVIIADPGCLAHGVDLFAAQTVVWYGPTDKTEVYLQANRRAHRPGQRYPVTVVQMTATPLEREIFKRLQANQALQGLLLNMVKEGRL